MTAKMQRQYEHILSSLRDYGRFTSDSKRKQVAAATVRKLQQNPSQLQSWIRNLTLDEEEKSEALSEDFHGRPVEDVIDTFETEEYDEYGAVLGFLVELGIETDEEDEEIPIHFDYDPAAENNVLVVSNPSGTNIEFVGGDQDIDWQSVDGAHLADKYLVVVGPVLSISYFTDKHHLAGPKDQKDGTEYQHQFGEEGGELPVLVFDRRNKKMLLVGGEYSVEPEGITG